MESAVLVLLLALPVLLFLAGRSGVRYRWTDDALVVQAGLRRARFPYAATHARLTAQPLGARLWGTQAPGTVTGRFALDRATVHALATTARPAQALVLRRAGQLYYVTPDHPTEHLPRFLPEHAE
ncbi:PH domain-containing protein [Deinococcus ficus]|uniref:Bacterial Pleckstrin homology domain-containing protein n=1 Tax=Deinococcus ficus TaxID=317577 RepID=A0A221T389_9DEIO|nr:PH domain-containing protein [Deinococcus ficus]ASN83362.1 hypothetical protein DFI_19380 [Deinococcus ficus]